MSKTNFFPLIIWSIPIFLSLFGVTGLFIADSNQSITCWQQLTPKIRDSNGDLELRLIDQHPIEPTFDGLIYIRSTHPNDMHIQNITITQFPERGYATSTYTSQMILDSNSLRMPLPKDFTFIARSGLHKYFPFDSSSFNIQLSINPPIHIEYLVISNRVPGFTFNCNTFHSALDNNNIHIVFTLSRNLLIQVIVAALVLGSIILIVAIIQLRRIENLITATAAFFFSMWSIRAILSSAIHTFPTLLDLWILSLSVIMLILLCYRIINYQGNNQEQNKTES